VTLIIVQIRSIRRRARCGVPFDRCDPQELSQASAGASE